ncbi:hypothetical protein [Serratia quinivorans]|uniref:hypothetical protein n=1 Tax=Serratia quinivorans TaxID=137545 RepID=UPI00217C5ED5|nr:hypothetical protein [Serratia quinivorans]CAI1105904.1 Uncharacterised protein [Serratia quinivorans]
MPSLDEIAENTSSQLASVLQSAVETISSNQQITFRLYVKQVLPLDGFVYWVNAAIINKDELSRLAIDSLYTVTIDGSLHRQVVTEQSETVSRNVNSIIFTPTGEIDDFNAESPDAMYLGEYAGTQFAFSRMESRYTQSGIIHYRGTAILPTMRTQIIDSLEDINEELILSNSTPIWLAMKQFATVYPSYLSPQNLRPPYIVADVRETRPLQMAPLAIDGARWQHVQDRVRITLYGFSNEQALNYLDHVIENALDENCFGITNMPVVTDGKSNQVEINALAKQKFIDFDVNYYQATTRDIALKLIKSAFINIEVS